MKQQKTQKKSKSLVSVRLTDETIETLDTTAQELGLNRSQIIERRLNHSQNGPTPALLAAFQDMINAFSDDERPEKQKAVNKAQKELNETWRIL